MNKIFIDTQILLFCLSEPERLSQKQKEILNSSLNFFYIHPVSFWEIQIKYDLGKLILPTTPELFLPPLIEKSGFLIEEFQVSSVYYLSKLPKLHKEPFARLLIANCWEANRSLMSSDEIFRIYPVRLIDEKIILPQTYPCLIVSDFFMNIVYLDVYIHLLH